MKYLLIPKSNYEDYFFDFFGLILPLKNYSIGFDYYFNVEEINELAKKTNVYVIINKFLHSKEIKEIAKELKQLKNIKAYFIEDMGLTNIISKEQTIIYQNHILNNYESINYLNTLGYKKCVISNELTINELKEIKDKTESELYYFLINRNMLLYSKRKLITNYMLNFNIKEETKKLNIKEKVSNHELIIKEENGSSVIFNKKIFSASSYQKDINYDYFIININNMENEEIKEILKNYKSGNINLDTDNYFLLNEIGYKVKKDEKMWDIKPSWRLRKT